MAERWAPTAAIASGAEIAGGELVGAVLAGGRSRRLLGGEEGLVGGLPRSKPAVVLAGRPLIAYPLAVLQAVCARVGVVCKRWTELPAVAAEVWVEPDDPQHPLAGLVHALERAGAPVLVCAGDMPFVTGDLCRGIVASAGRVGLVGPGPPRRLPAVVAASPGGLEPLLGVYSPAALHELRSARPDASLRAVVEALDPLTVAVPARAVRSVNTPADLAAAEAELTAGGYRPRAGSRSSTATSATP